MFQPIISTFYAYLDSSISSNDNNLTMPGYDLYRADYPSNVKRLGFVSTIKMFFR